MLLEQAAALNKLVHSLWGKVFLATCAYYLSLYFSVNNRSFLLLTGIYILGVFIVTKRPSLSFFLVFVATLPFAKGQAYQILMLPIDQIRRYAWYNISYFFPFYMSDVFLLLSAYCYVRDKVHSKGKRILPKWPFVIFAGFMAWALLSSVMSIYPEVGFLSFVQLIRLFIVMSLPSLLPEKRENIQRGAYCILAATLLFESLWALTQWTHGGPLGKDIEVYLPGAKFGIRSSEDAAILRTTGTFFEPSILGTFLLMQMSLMMQTVVSGKQSWRIRFGAALLCIIASAALIVTGSRIIYGICMVFTGYILWSNRHGIYSVLKTNILRFWRIGVLAAIGFGALVPYVIVRMSSLTDVFTTYGSAMYRLNMMVYAVRLVQFSPFFGVGLSLSPYYYATSFIGENLHFDPTYPHNLLFQLLLETGVIGVGLFGAFLVSVFRPALQVRPLNPFTLAALIYTVCATFYPIFINQQEIISYLFLGIGMYFVTRERNEIHA